MKNAVALALGGLALVLLTGCPFESTVPLGSPGPASLDPLLAGRWVGDGTNDRDGALVEIDFLPFGPEQYYVELREPGKAPERFRAYTVRIGGQPFLNVVDLKPDAPSHPYSFLRYSIGSDGAMALRFVGDKNVPKELGSDQAALVKFVEGHLAGGFLDDSEKPVVLLRPKAATGLGPAKEAKGETAGKRHVPVPVVAPRPDDVATIDGMIRAWYEVVSGPAGRPREWGRDRTLYMPDLRFVTVETGKGEPSVRIQDHQAYVDGADAVVAKGFFEREIHRVTERFGPVAHVWSTYESRLAEDGPVTARGINSIELFWDGRRWWISHGAWTGETKENPIPREYLPAAK